MNLLPKMQLPYPIIPDRIGITGTQTNDGTESIVYIRSGTERVIVGRAKNINRASFDVNTIEGIALNPDR